MTTKRSQPLRIVHACNFHYNKSGDKYDTMDQKIHQGLGENGHYIYPFPVHDIGRQLSWTNSKRFGAAKANRSLIETCRKIHPDVLLLGHSQSITTETLEIIRKNIPEIKIAQWFCDWFYSARTFKYAFIFERLHLLDAFFATTSGEKLEAFQQKGCRTAFIPNLVHPAIEKHRTFENQDFDYDLVFFGTDRKDPERSETLREIESALSGQLKIGIFGSLGRSGAYGHEKEQILARSKAALNLTRLPEPMPLYSSDRIANLLGNGLLTCTRSDNGLDQIYGVDAMLYYKDTQDLIEQLPAVLKENTWRETARKGWESAHKGHNAKCITQAMVEFIYGQRENCINI
jgi:hypothetical protein